MAKFLVDECLGVILARWLKKKGYDIIAVVEAMPGADDHEVLSKSLVEQRILVTLDSDFGEIIFKKNVLHAGIIFLRLEDEQPSNQINVMEKVLKNYLDDLVENFTVATEETIRIVRLHSKIQA